MTTHHVFPHSPTTTLSSCFIGALLLLLLMIVDGKVTKFLQSFFSFFLSLLLFRKDRARYISEKMSFSDLGQLCFSRCEKKMNVYIFSNHHLLDETKTLKKKQESERTENILLPLHYRSETLAFLLRPPKSLRQKRKFDNDPTRHISTVPSLLSHPSKNNKIRINKCPDKKKKHHTQHRSCQILLQRKKSKIPTTPTTRPNPTAW